MASFSVGTATLAALAALLSGLLSALLTQWLYRSTEHRKWLRQERYVAFARLLSAAESVKNESAYVGSLYKSALNLPSLVSDTNERITKGAGDSVEDRAFDNLRKSLLKESGRDAGSMISKANQVLMELDNALAGVRLLASENVVDHALKLVTASRELLPPPRDDEAVTVFNQNYRDARKNFVDASQRDLK